MGLKNKTKRSKGKRGAPSKVMTVGDVHFPFADTDALAQVLDAIKREQPTHVVQIGDLYDQYSFSRFSRSFDVMTPKDEVIKARKQAEAFWQAVQKAAPKAICHQLLGNHDVRVTKKILDKIPEFESLGSKVRDDLYTFKGVNTLHDVRSWIEIDDVIYTHGWYSTLGQHMDYFGKSVVHGHTHRAGIAYARRGEGFIFEMDVGHLADETTVPLQYSASKLSRWFKTVSIVENGQPRLQIITKGST